MTDLGERCSCIKQRMEEAELWLNMKNTKDKNELKKIIFRPTWKEIIVCEYDNHNFVLEFSMGNPTFYFPKKEAKNKIKK